MSNVTPLEPLKFPLHGSRLIEASAGTGKTYTIAALYVRLVLQHGEQEQRYHRSLSPDEILVVTFTKAATAELRDRIRTRLAEAAAYFREELSSDEVDEFLQKLRTSYDSQNERWPELAYRLDMASQGMDEAAVSTIHGWCNRMLQEHAFSSGSLFTQTLEADQDALKHTAIRDYWRTWLYQLPTEHYHYFLSEFGGPDKLARQIDKDIPSQAITPQEPDQALSDFAEQYHQLRSTSGLTEASLQDALTTLYKADEEGILHGGKLNRSKLEGLDSTLRAWVETPSIAQQLPRMTEAQERNLSTTGFNSLLKKGKQLEIPEFFVKLSDFRAALAKLASPNPSLLLHASQWFASRMAELQDIEAVMGYNDMLLRLRDALRQDQSGKLGSAIRKQFPVALIDEFQDTDPVQYEIFNRVYRLSDNCPDQGVFLIGDPKQAIYSFRDADIYTYLQARRDTSGRHYTLDTNFRSTKNMVDAVNHAFSVASEFDKGAFRFKAADGDEQVPFVEVSPNGLKQHFVRSGKPVTALQVRYQEQQGKKSPGNDSIAADFANEIAKLLNDPDSGFVQEGDPEKEREFRALKPGDIAVLVNTGTEATAVKKALAERAIKSVYLSDRNSVYQGLLASEVLMLLEAMAYPQDANRVRAALATRLAGLSVSGLVAMHEDEITWEHYVQHFHEYHQLWQHAGILAALHRFMHDFDISSVLLKKADGERLLTDFMHMAELLQRQAVLTDGMHGLLRYLSERIAESQASQNGNSTTNVEEQQVRLESDDNLVQIVTIHSSKGLQYPLVFLPFVCQLSDIRKKPDFPATYHDEKGTVQVLWSAKDLAGMQRFEHEMLEEDIRKLYVAMTRAQFATVMGAGNLSNVELTALRYLVTGKEPGEEAPLSAELIESVWPSNVAEVVSVTAPEMDPPVIYQPQVATNVRLEAREFPVTRKLEQWWLASYSALKYGDSVYGGTPPGDKEHKGNEHGGIEHKGSVTDSADNENLQQEYAEQAAQQLAEDAADLSYSGTEYHREPEGIHAFPKGPVEGTFLHNLLEDAAGVGFATLSADSGLCKLFVEERTEQEPWINHRSTLTQWFTEYLSTPFSISESGVQLDQLTNYKAEPEFWFPARDISAEQVDQLVCKYVMPAEKRPRLLPRPLNGMLKGFIDLVFEHDGKYFVADYKSNWIGSEDQSYTREAMQEKILHSRYDLQFVIYTLALHKLLKQRLGQDYDYDKHVGGAVYLFFRGHKGPEQGSFFHRPERELIEKLDALFEGNGGVLA